jgi:hypothetical protein
MDTREYTRAVGLWNHVLIMIWNPLCSTPLAPKEMLQGGFGVFYFYEIATAVVGFGFNDDKRMQRKYDKKDPSRGSLHFVESSPSAPVSVGGALVSIWERVSIGDATVSIGEKKSGAGGRFPPIPSLLLPPNNKETLKSEAFTSSCLHPCSYYCCV